MSGWEAVGHKRSGKINHKLNVTITKCFGGGEQISCWVAQMGFLFGMPVMCSKSSMQCW